MGILIRTLLVLLIFSGTFIFGQQEGEVQNVFEQSYKLETAGEYTKAINLLKTNRHLSESSVL